ncbi:amine oxidase [Niveomyces insectorum RCEF 264]|uniref:Amine oxidase n=1 Tax=Niveomyces insectorum RCEF 264 TaxID=1081102 RepID=A0A167TA28_9HYPO|nr:amine oxidase [Niveomyces insectorum RCEF 264]
MTGQTSDGYSWTAADGLQKGGFACDGVVVPPRKLFARADHVYDVLIVGGGYAGLSAARDLTIAGRRVLLVEGRDRVGGRTYTIREDGYNYEMGGTWVSHAQPFTFRELLRYGLDRDLIKTRTEGQANDYYTFKVPGCPDRKVTHEEAGKLAQRGWDLFVNVDGNNCRTICPLPHAQLDNIEIDRKAVEKWDAYSCWDRYLEIKDQLSAEEDGLLRSLLLHISGGEDDLKNSSLWDMIRSHALGFYDFANFGPVWLLYKLRTGQSGLARRMFREAVDHGLEYAFQTHVAAITQANGLTHVLTRGGERFTARKLVCTVPLNALNSVRFDPPLSPLRQEAIRVGHVNRMAKIHAVVQGPGLASWNGVCYPSPLMYCYGDGLLPNGDTHLVAFGCDERRNMVPERDPERVVDTFKKFHEMDVKKLVFHNWNTDPYSQSGPSFWPPGYMTKYQDELQKRHGNVFFASADWAHGWRAFIDGALEQGFLNGLEILRELRAEQPRPPLARM